MAQVAVIVPCHNDGLLVEGAVESIREPQLIEVVVVDDGSTDEVTLRALDRLGDGGVRIVRQANAGPGVARTHGLRETTAPFVCALDADDRFEPGALSALASVLESCPDEGFVWGNYTLFGDYEGAYRSPDRWLPWTLTYVNAYPMTSLFRRDVLDAVGGWPDLRGYEDWDLWLRLVGIRATGVWMDGVVYHRRIHGDARVNPRARRRHQELFAMIQERNPEVFARRRTLRLAERPAAWKRLAYPVIFGPRKVVPIAVETFLQRALMRLGSGLPG